MFFKFSKQERNKLCALEHAMGSCHGSRCPQEIASFILFFLFLFFLFFFITPSVFAASIREGLEYQRKNTPHSQVVHILTIDPQKYAMVSQHAKGQALGLSTLSDLAEENKAIAAINGGYFHMGEKKDGLPAGILKIRGEWYGIAYTNRAAVGWSSKENQVPILLIDRLQTKTTLKINHRFFPVHALNQPAGATRAVIYTKAYGKFEKNGKDSVNYIVRKNRIVGKVESNETPIPEDGLIYSLGKNVAAPTYDIAIGDKVNFDIEVIPSKGAKQHKKLWQSMDNIVGGTPLLIHNKQLAINENQQHMQKPFANLRRARTALGTDSKGRWIWVVVENNHKENKLGMTLLELAEFMKSLGCVQALNLDGGSSTALYLENKLVTAPEDDPSEGLSFPILRRIGDALLLQEKNR